MLFSRSFCKEQFLKDCERDIIPNVLEAMIRGDLEILKDWCYEAPFNILSAPVKQAMTMGYFFDSRVLDIDHLDLAMGKMMEQERITKAIHKMIFTMVKHLVFFVMIKCKIVPRK
jgi:hypothetical protein